MPAALAQSIREEIVTRRQSGARLSVIARDLGVSYNATWRIWKQYQRESDIKPHYERCRSTAVRKDVRVYEAVITMKHEHPHWGAGLILLELKRKYKAEQLPSERTVQRWFHRAGVATVTSKQVERVKVRRGRAAHEVWAMDAKEHIQLADGSYVSWLAITDEGSGAVLSADLFPLPTMDTSSSTEG